MVNVDAEGTLLAGEDGNIGNCWKEFFIPDDGRDQLGIVVIEHALKSRGRSMGYRIRVYGLRPVTEHVEGVFRRGHTLTTQHVLCATPGPEYHIEVKFRL